MLSMYSGVVPEEPEMLELANGDVVESAPPISGIDIKVNVLLIFCRKRKS